MKSLITYSQRKSMLIRDNGRSADFMAPAFGFGCLFSCSYCTLKRHKQLAIRDWRRNKPIMILQTNGGPINEQPYNYSWTRDMPFSTSQAIVNAFKNDYHIIQICRNENNVIEGTEPLFKPMTNMELFSLLMASEKRVLIDSSLQHAAAAMGLPSVVLWVGTSPTVFGYGLHKNIISNLPEIKLPDSYLFDYSFNGSTQECPFIDDNIFNPEIVIQTILQ